MKTYTIVGGVNGVGKSSLTGVLKSRTTDLGVIVDVDRHQLYSRDHPFWPQD